MITPDTTTVWVRVDLASNRVIGVSDEILIGRPGQPTFEVAANFDKLPYYIVVPDVTAKDGCTVRPATVAEIAAIDDADNAAASVAMARAKSLKADAIKAFYDGLFMKRFISSDFLDTEELMAVVLYTGTNTHVLTTVKPLAESILNAYVDWRFTVCEPVIEEMFADTTNTMGVTLDDTYRVSTNTVLDTFLTAQGFDIATYHR